jgi:hydrogenase maturation protease
MKIVVIGVGNPFRRDDGVGPDVVTRLRAAGAAGAAGLAGTAGVTLAASLGEATELIDLWDGADVAILVDAVRAGPPHPGRVHRLAVYQPPGERARAASSHGMDLGEAVELGRVLGRLPARLVIYAIEVADIEHGTGLSPAVADAARHVAEEIAGEVAALHAGVVP